jgi:hypothetical protein
VVSLAISPDGAYVASGDALGRIKLWRTDVLPIACGVGGAGRDGQAIAGLAPVLGDGGRMVVYRRTPSPWIGVVGVVSRLSVTLGGDSPLALSAGVGLSADGKMIAESNGTVVRLRDAETGAVVRDVQVGSLAGIAGEAGGDAGQASAAAVAFAGLDSSTLVVAVKQAGTSARAKAVNAGADGKNAPVRVYAVATDGRAPARLVAWFDERGSDPALSPPSRHGVVVSCGRRVIVLGPTLEARNVRGEFAVPAQPLAIALDGSGERVGAVCVDDSVVIAKLSGPSPSGGEGGGGGGPSVQVQLGRPLGPADASRVRASLAWIDGRDQASARLATSAGGVITIWGVEPQERLIDLRAQPGEDVRGLCYDAERAALWVGIVTPSTSVVRELGTGK